jgi:hypothetical protein
VIRSFTCEACGTTFTTSQTHVRTWLIDKWWLMVGHQCASCRVERQGEPRQSPDPEELAQAARYMATAGRPSTPEQMNALEERMRQRVVGSYHANGRSTEVASALAATPLLGRHRQRVLHLLRTYTDGLTDDEGGQHMGGDRLTFGRRRSELAKAGLVKDSGVRRPTKYGRPAIVWVLATEKGEPDAAV